MQLLIGPETAAFESNIIAVPENKVASFAQKGLIASEVIKFQINLEGKWVDTMPIIQLTSTLNYLQISGPGSYRIVKAQTANPVSVYTD